MKTCPVCRERFEDELRFCTFDGSPLSGGLNTAVGSASTRTLVAGNRGEYERGRNGWKAAFFVLLLIVLAGAGAGAVYFFKMQQNRTPAPVMTMQPVTTAFGKVEPAASAPEPAPPKPASLAELSREELMERLPKNLTRRFHMGEPGQGIPDDLRIISGEKDEYVVMLGSGRLEGSSRIPVERMLVLKYEENEFKDATREILPPAYVSGSVNGRGAQVKFDEGGNNILVREPASSNSVVQECASCDHAYQVVTLEWKKTRYVESGRTWENDRYTVFYIVADALDKKRVDARARPFIEGALDPVIAQGFARNGKEGWTVEWRGDDEAETAGYELANNADRLVITVSRVKGQWKAVRID